MTRTRRRPYLWILLLVLGFVAGLVFWLVNFEPVLSPRMGLIIALAVALLALPVYRAVQQARDEKAGVPLEDELIRERRILAGARAYHLSLYLWLAIFLFNSKFQDREEMLGVGILGSAALFGICWFMLKLRGHERAD